MNLHGPAAAESHINFEESVVKGEKHKRLKLLRSNRAQTERKREFGQFSCKHLAKFACREWQFRCGGTLTCCRNIVFAGHGFRSAGIYIYIYIYLNYICIYNYLYIYLHTRDLIMYDNQS